MKRRNGLVTNSSSSSYIIAYRTVNIDEEGKKKYPILKSYNEIVEKILTSKGGYETEVGDKITNQQELDEYMLDTYAWGTIDTIDKLLKDDQPLREKYEKALQYIKDGFYIYCKDVGYDDEGLAELIQSIAEDSEDFVILEECG